MIKGSIQEEDITIINIYALNIGALQYVRQMLTSMKGEIKNNTMLLLLLSPFTKRLDLWCCVVFSCSVMSNFL